MNGFHIIADYPESTTTPGGFVKLRIAKTKKTIDRKRVHLSLILRAQYQQPYSIKQKPARAIHGRNKPTSSDDRGEKDF